MAGQYKLVRRQPSAVALQHSVAAALQHSFQFATVTMASVAVATALVATIAYELSSLPTHLNCPLSSDCGYNRKEYGQWPSGLCCRQV